MKAEELLEIALDLQDRPVVIEMPDGRKLTTKGCRYGTDKRGQKVLVISAGKEKQP